MRPRRFPQMRLQTAAYSKVRTQKQNICSVMNSIIYIDLTRVVAHVLLIRHVVRDIFIVGLLNHNGRDISTCITWLEKYYVCMFFCGFVSPRVACVEPILPRDCRLKSDTAFTQSGIMNGEWIRSKECNGMRLATLVYIPHIVMWDTYTLPSLGKHAL